MNDGLQSKVYIYGNKRSQVYTFMGLKFHDFIEGLTHPPQQLLLLKHSCSRYETNYYTGFDYVEGEDIQFLKEESDRFEKFCWIDFQDISSLEELQPRNIADLLYFAHKKEPIERPFLTHLNNRFAYFSENDMSRIYFRKLFDVMGLVSKIMQYKINESSRKKFLFFQKTTSLPIIPIDLIEKLLPFIEEGLLINFEKRSDNRKEIVLPLYVSQSENDFDDNLFQLDIDESRVGHFADLILNKKDQLWTIKYI